MPDFNDRREQSSAPKPPKFTLRHLIAFSLLGIFAVLTLANLDSILRPFKTLGSMLAPITIGLVLAYIANFCLRFFEYKLFNKVKKRTLNRAFSMLLTYMFLLLVIAGIIWLIIPSVINSVQDLRANGMLYVTRVIDSINRMLAKVPFIQTENGSDVLQLETLLNFVIEFLSSSGSWIVSNLATIAGSTLTVLKNILVGIFISIYVLLSKERLNAGCRRVFRALFPPKSEKLLLHYFSTAHNKFGGYMIGKLLDSMLVMLVCMLLFAVFKIPYAVLIAVIIGVTDIIPFFGPFIGAIPSAVIIFIASPMKAVIFVLLILVVQQIDGNLIAPVILGNKTGLSSLGVIVAVTVTGGLMGITGMLIGVPLFALIMILLDDFIKSQLQKKGYPTDLKEYYPADAFIRPQDETTNNETLTQRFVHWVRTVETEDVPEDISRLRAFNRSVRRFFLTVGRFFNRLFSIRPIPEDHSGGIFTDITQNGMRTNRLFWRTFFLSIISFGIYPFYMIEIMAQCTNIACRNDQRRTWGVLPFILLSFATLGIFPLIWHYKLIRRFQYYCNRNGVKYAVTPKFYLCWTLLGAPILVGPLIAIARVLRGFSQICTIYNSKHTFPLSEEEVRNERLKPNTQPPRKQRQTFIDLAMASPEDDTFGGGVESNKMLTPDAELPASHPDEEGDSAL